MILSSVPFLVRLFLKPGSTGWFVRGAGVGLVGAGLVCGGGPWRWGACVAGVGGCGGLVALGVRLRCVGRGARVR